MTERRYSNAEVATIFERASEAQPSASNQLTSATGMTLAELQDIGREVGIEPSVIAQAALSVSVGELATSSTFLGLPIAVGRTVEIDRKLSDDEWEQLVVVLRTTFDARGVVRSEGSLRQWTNGNLQALLEPTPTGQRLRLRTVKGDARGLMVGGLAMLGISAAFAAAAMLFVGAGDRGMMGGLASLGMIGAGMFGAGALRLPAWARQRRQQMHDVAARLSAAATSK